jgi:hypothetical protein
LEDLFDFGLRQGLLLQQSYELIIDDGTPAKFEGGARLINVVGVFECRGVDTKRMRDQESPGWTVSLTVINIVPARLTQSVE